MPYNVSSIQIRMDFFLPSSTARSVHLPFKKSAAEKNYTVCACAHTDNFIPRDLYALFISIYN